MKRKLFNLVFVGLLVLPSAGAFAQTPTSTPSPTPTMTPTPTATPDYRALLPVGAVLPWAGSSTPTGWLLADGSCLVPADYPALFAAIGETFGWCEYNPPQGGNRMFRLPDLRGRVPVGAGQGSGLTARALAAMFGEETHMLTVPEMPSHDHNRNTSGVAEYAIRYGSAGIYGISAGSSGLLSNLIKTSSSGGGAAHNVVQPSLALNYIINAGTLPLVIAGSTGGGNVEITPEPYWVISTVEVDGVGYPVGFAYTATAGDIAVTIFLFALLIVVSISLMLQLKERRTS